VPTSSYVLGKDCELRIEYQLIESVQDVLVRETTAEVDATKFGSAVQCSIATHRSYEIQATIADVAVAKSIAAARVQTNGPFTVPNIIRISLAGGLFNIDTTFTVSDIEGDEPLDGPVLPRFTFKQFE
jgi:hypothetical protein